MYHGGAKKQKINPRQTASLLSLITFSFTYDLFKKSRKQDIGEDDLYTVIPKFKSKKLGNRLEKQWLHEQKMEKPSIFRLLWACYGRYYILLGFIQLIMKIILVLFQPFFLGRLVSYFGSKSDLTHRDAIFYAVKLILINLVYCTYAHNYMFWLMELGIRVKTAMCSLIYRKSLRLTPSSLSDISLGKLVTLITKDVNSFEIAIIFLNDMWISLILLSITSYLMYIKVGVAVFPGVIFLILIIPLQIFFGKLTSTFRLEAAKLTDFRLQVTQETLSAIKIIKMYTWEKIFGLKISKAREEEMNKIKNIYFTKAVSLVIGGLVINITFYMIVMTYSYLGHSLTAEVAFYVLTCLHTLRSSVTISIPIGIAQCAELIASATRIQTVLTADEQLEPPPYYSPTEKPLIQLEDVAVKIKDKMIIHNINLIIDSGLNFLTGRLGGGKSSMLKTILQDYPVCHGKLQIQGSISYASEEPWLFPSTIRQNILFGQKFDRERYKKVLKICALEQDIDSFDDGDESIVDDRGMNLSKGQQARINLARAVYHDSDIYLLDDCLSALDTHVQDFVFKECVKGFLKDKIVIMISHNERHIREANSVIVMENGTIKSVMEPNDITEEELDRIIGDDDKEQEDLDIVDNIKIKDEIDNDTIDESSKLLNKKPSSNIYHEEKKEGKVEFLAYKKYYKYGGSIVFAILIIILFTTAQIGTSLSEKLVSQWVNIHQELLDLENNRTNETLYQSVLVKNTRVLQIYSVTIVIATILVLLRAYAHFSFAVKCSIGLHKSLIEAVLNATMEFFDIRYIGNILNRFSKDLGTLDELLPLIIYECLRGVFVLIGVIVLIAMVNTYFLIPVKIVFLVLFAIRKLYLPVGRSLKRLDAATRSPVIGHFNASIEGITTIRATRSHYKLISEFDEHQDMFTSAFHMMQCASRTFAYSLDMLCNLFVASVIIILLIKGKSTEVGNVGLAITQAMMLTGVLQWIVRQWAELENHMTSVERVLEYCDIEKENKAGQVIENWPQQGKITFKNVYLKYGHSNEYVLKNINFTISGNEKIGIVGRTGAGKSSLISTIFRLYKSEGTVTIDDIDIKNLALQFLRSSIAIIPQDPVLFEGTIRSNIDPTSRYSDEEIWQAIEVTEIKDLVSDLDQQIVGSGFNFSSGQKQLICLARAIISKNKIIILDEATANIDPETDVLIYTTIQKSFADCTVITIAHRLHTVLYSDQVIVVDKGQIVEYDNPQVLLENKKGVFFKMVQQACLLK